MLVAPGISQQLDALKHTYHGLPDFLTQAHTSFPHGSRHCKGPKHLGPHLG